MNKFTRYIEHKVHELKSQGVTDFYKQRAELSNDCTDYSICAEDPPRLDWDTFEGDHYSPDYMWLLFYFDGKEYSKALIAPDEVLPQDIEYWFHVKNSAIEKLRIDKESKFEFVLEQFNRGEEYYKSVIENAITSYEDVAEYPLGEKPRIYNVSNRLADVRAQIEHGDVPISDLIWWMVHEAYLAGKDAEYIDAQPSRELAKRSKTMMDRQRSSSRKSSKEWIIRVESLLASDFSMSAEAIAEALKAEGFCDYSDWGQDIILSDSSEKPKTQNSFRCSISRIKKRLRKPDC